MLRPIEFDFCRPLAFDPAYYPRPSSLPHARHTPFETRPFRVYAYYDALLDGVFVRTQNLTLPSRRFLFQPPSIHCLSFDIYLRLLYFRKGQVEDPPLHTNLLTKAEINTEFISDVGAQHAAPVFN